MIPASEWAKWIDTGQITEQRLVRLVEKIRNNEPMNKQEQSMYIHHATEIEARLKKK